MTIKNSLLNTVHADCVLCGSRNPLSLGLSFHPGDDGGVRTLFQAHSGLQGYKGILHGGVISSLLDAAMTHCLFHQGIEAVTGDLHVRFVKSVPCDAQMELLSAGPEGRATLVSVERQTDHWQANHGMG